MAGEVETIKPIILPVLTLLIVSLLSCNKDDDLSQTDNEGTAHSVSQVENTVEPVKYGNCPAFEDVDDDIPDMEDDVTLHTDLVEDTIEAIKRELGYTHTIKDLEIEGAGEAIEVSVTDFGIGDRMTGPRYELGDGRELYWNIHLWGSATFSDGSDVGFQLWAKPVPAGSDCEIQSVSIQPLGFVPY